MNLGRHAGASTAALGDYLPGCHSLHHLRRRTGAVRVFACGHVNALASLDDVDLPEWVAAPVRYSDGCHATGMRPPRVLDISDLRCGKLPTELGLGPEAA